MILYFCSKKFLPWIWSNWFHVFCKWRTRVIFWDIFHEMCFIITFISCFRTFSFWVVNFSSRNITSVVLSWFYEDVIELFVLNCTAFIFGCAIILLNKFFFSLQLDNLFSPFCIIKLLATFSLLFYMSRFKSVTKISLAFVRLFFCAIFNIEFISIFQVKISSWNTNSNSMLHWVHPLMKPSISISFVKHLLIF